VPRRRGGGRRTRGPSPPAKRGMGRGVCRRRSLFLGPFAARPTNG
jgi:hypothetical protein